MELDYSNERIAKCATMQGAALGSSAAFDKANWAVNLSDHKFVPLPLQMQNIFAGEQGLPDFSARTTRVTGPALTSTFAALLRRRSRDTTPSQCPIRKNRNAGSASRQRPSVTRLLVAPHVFAAQRS
jgi:hypothetical protein